MNLNELNKVFTSLSLAGAREEAKAQGVTIPKGLTTYQPVSGYYEVWSKDDGIVWQGNAYNASDAKANYIFGLLD